MKLGDIIESYTRDAVPTAVGRAAIAWNNLHFSIFQTFIALSDLDSKEAATIFFTIKSDRSQRDIVTGLIELRLKPLDKKLAKQLNSVLGVVNALAGKRNDTLHVVYVDDLDSTKTRVYHDAGYLAGKVGNDLIVAIHKLTIDMLDAAITIGQLNQQIPKVSRMNRRIARALLAGIPPQISGELATATEYGLLGGLAKIPPPPEESQG
jgi:hypothetical protein